MRRNKKLPGPLDFHDGGSLRIRGGQGLLAWRHARGQVQTLSPVVPAVKRGKCGSNRNVMFAFLIIGRSR